MTTNFKYFSEMKEKEARIEALDNKRKELSKQINKTPEERLKEIEARKKEILAGFEKDAKEFSTAHTEIKKSLGI